MEIEYDADKDAANIAKHGLTLADAGMLDLNEADVIADERTDYGETRDGAAADQLSPGP